MRVSRSALAVSLAVSAALGTVARSAEPTYEELKKQLSDLQARVDNLETHKGPTAAEVDAIVHRIVNDAQSRSQLLAADAGFTAGYDDSAGGFVIRSADGSFKLNPQVQYQMRYSTAYRDGAGGADSDIQSGFEFRRLKFILDGNVWSKDLVYRFQWATNRASSGTAGTSGFSAAGDLILEEAYLRYKFADDWAVRGGQFKEGFYHEQQISSVRQMAVDRTLMNDALVGGESYVQGIDLIFDNGGPLRWDVQFHDGINSRNTNFTDQGGGVSTLGVINTDFGVAFRADYQLLGKKFKGYDDFTARGNTEDLLVVGAGADWTQAGNRNLVLHTFDVQFENSAGLGLYAGFLGAYRQFDDLGADFYDWGFVVQASYAFNSKWEGFVRYDQMFLDDGAPGFSGEDNFPEITGGVNYYFHNHRLKGTLDLSYLPNGAPSDQTGLDILSSSEAEWILRAQLQLIL